MKIEEYSTKPKKVLAVKLEQDNIRVVAKWCNGAVTHYYDPNLADELRMNGQLAKAGHHWIVRENHKFIVLTDRRFKSTYESETTSIVEFEHVTMGLEELRLKFRNYGKPAEVTERMLEKMFEQKSDEALD